MDKTKVALNPPLRAFWMKIGEQKRVPATYPREKQKRKIFSDYNWMEDMITWTTAKI